MQDESEFRCSSQPMDDVYFPPARGAWATAPAADVGIDGAQLDQALRFAASIECDWPRSMYTGEGKYVGTAYLQEQPPLDEVLGPVQPRGPTAGVVVRHGRIAGQWGDVHRPDMTFSVAKSYLAMLTGLAVDDGLISDLQAPVRATPGCPDALKAHFSDAANAEITWQHLLFQTSEWSGTLWSKPDTVDSNRQTDAGAAVDNTLKGSFRERRQPGDYWEYNDVRVNLLALCLVYLFRRPLHEVLRTRIMDPIGASKSWTWAAYANALVDIDGAMLPSVPGGGHWGGGLIISTLDHARFGYLVLRNGNWAGRQLISKAWTVAMARPCPLNHNYGSMWWLNTDGKHCADAPASCLYAAGAGGNIIWIDRQHDLVVVCRWTAKDKIGALLSRITGAITEFSD